jgi:hypothetical protein
MRQELTPEAALAELDRIWAEAEALAAEADTMGSDAISRLESLLADVEAVDTAAVWGPDTGTEDVMARVDEVMTFVEDLLAAVEAPVTASALRRRI